MCVFVCEWYVFVCMRERERERERERVSLLEELRVESRGRRL